MAQELVDMDIFIIVKMKEMDFLISSEIHLKKNQSHSTAQSFSV